ncbi:MAG: ferredoxin family protein [Halanaeroarchaeum sp.]
MAAAIETTRTDEVTISVDTTLCKGCEICVAQCPTDVYEMQGTGPNSRPVPTDAEACIDCSKCELLCPDFALEVESV